MASKKARILAISMSDEGKELKKECVLRMMDMYRAYKWKILILVLKEDEKDEERFKEKMENIIKDAEYNFPFDVVFVSDVLDKSDQALIMTWANYICINLSQSVLITKDAFWKKFAKNVGIGKVEIL